MRPSRFASTVFTFTILIGAAGCSGPEDDSQAEATDSSCNKEDLNLVNDDQLTVATDEPVFQPWFVDDDPSNGEGFESAVAYAVAENLGFARTQLEWVRQPFSSLFQPGPKNNYDFAINEVSITDERRQAVDFSVSYYEVNPAVIALNDSPVAGATSISELKDANLGAIAVSTSFDAISDVIEPTNQPQGYNDNTAVIAALENRQIDAAVVDTPTAFQITAAQIENSKIVGQILPPADSEREEFGLVLEKGNALVTCVNRALQELKDNGELDRLTQHWLAEASHAPILRDQ